MSFLSNNWPSRGSDDYVTQMKSVIDEIDTGLAAHDAIIANIPTDITEFAATVAGIEDNLDESGHIALAGIEGALGEYGPLTNRDIQTVNARDHAVDPTGVTDSYAGLLNAVEDALDKGRALSLAGGKYRCSQPLVISEPIVIDGGASGERQGFDTILGAELNFDADVPGVSLERQAIGSVLRNIAITSKTNYFGETLGGSETDDGLTVKAERWRLDQVSVRWFGRHGYYFDSVSHASDNADLGVATGIEAHYNGKDGIRLDGDVQ